MKPLTKTDYQTILEYYNIPYTKKYLKKELKDKAEQIIADKLCSCIGKNKEMREIKDKRKYKNKITKKNKEKIKEVEKKMIPICIYNVINKKGLKISGFNCKNENLEKNSLKQDNSKGLYKHHDNILTKQNKKTKKQKK